MAQNNTDVQRRTGEACESTGMVVCFHGVCGGSVDRGVICPHALRGPPDCWSQTYSLSNRIPIK